MMSEKGTPGSGKRLVLYGMFSLVLITFVSSFFSLAVIMRLIDPNVYGAGEIVQLALVPSLVVTGVALVACVIGWFVYTKVILKE
jgi:hypothetical protein